ncbi:hypothetical protein [Streptomyces sp. E1N211]|uniref:hypothetical protein n=1 Tax=Streptomyces sp. E1N211 TaxID=1851876 RepID=UPI0019D46E7E|nr:hypothetical protein [Streptomyces sp. E1N211]
MVARTGLWNAANGLPLPDVTVSGRRTARLVGRDLAKVRAEAVAGTFRRELADALAALQAGTPGPHLTADRFTVDPVSARVSRASTGGVPGADTVDITVDDQRGGPRHVATRGPRGSLRTDGGLRGGSRDDGLDPVAEQWPIGRPVTLTSPRHGDITRGPVSVVPVGEAPAAHRPADPKGKSPATGTERPPGLWYAYTRTADSRTEPFRYEVADTGHIRLPDGTEIPPGGWRRFGHDFVHEATGTLLRGDSGWIGRVANMEFLAPRLAELDPDPVPHRIAADPDALYVVPAHGSTALRVPLGQQAPPPVLRRDDRPRTVVRSAFDVRRFTHGGDTVTDLTVRLALRPHGEATDAVTARVAEGVERFYNRPGHRLPGGDRPDRPRPADEPAGVVGGRRPGGVRARARAPALPPRRDPRRGQPGPPRRAGQPPRRLPGAGPRRPRAERSAPPPPPAVGRGHGGRRAVHLTGGGELARGPGCRTGRTAGTRLGRPRVVPRTHPADRPGRRGPAAPASRPPHDDGAGGVRAVRRLGRRAGLRRGERAAALGRHRLAEHRLRPRVGRPPR